MKKYLVTMFLVLLSVSVFGCSKAYNSEEALKRGDVVAHVMVENVERFQQFLTNFENKKKDTIRVTHYTFEGDPIFLDLVYDGKQIHYRMDSSHDKFVGEETNKIVKDVCSGITKKERKEEDGTFVEFSLSGCSKLDDTHILTLEKDKSKK